MAVPGRGTIDHDAERPPLIRAVRLAAVLSSVALAACSHLVRYTDELVDRRTGRTVVVTAPAAAGGFVGFVVGLPVDVVALPVTYAVYATQKARSPASVDPLSTMLFPSFVLWRAGTLFGVPFDVVEYAAWRAWQPERSMTEEERKRFEAQLDEEALPAYPVETLEPLVVERSSG
jgi:hypothetical protein